MIYLHLTDTHILWKPAIGYNDYADTFKEQKVNKIL